jgi:hypothetical protein
MGLFEFDKIITGKFREGDIVEIIETGEIAEVIEVLGISDVDTEESYTEEYRVRFTDGREEVIHEDELEFVKRPHRPKPFVIKTVPPPVRK